MTFRELLRELLDEKGFSVRDLADAARLSHSTVGSYLTGSRLPTFSSAVAMARVLGANLEQFAACDDFANPSSG